MLPYDIIIDILIKYTRLEMLYISYVNKNLNIVYWESIKYNKKPFHLTFIDSILELYLYTLSPKIDIIRYKLKDDDKIRLFYSFLSDHIKICKECDIQICNEEDIRDDSSLVYC